LWTHTKNAERYFESITKGWIKYEQNKFLVDFFAKALVATEEGHKESLKPLMADIKAKNLVQN
jgi:hypothetical protein